MILRITDAAATAAGPELLVSTDAPPPELVEELARAAYLPDDGDTLDQTAPGVHEAYRNTVKRILCKLAEKVKV